MSTVTDEKVAPAETTETADELASPGGRRAAITVSIRRSSVLVALAIAGSLIAAVVFGCLYWSARSTIADRDTATANDKHAESVATDYAVGASTVDYHDANAWLTRLKANTSPQLSAKFDATAPQLQQILAPLQWISKATPLSATVTSESGGIYKVNAYLTVNSTSAQSTDGAQTTVTYSLTIDANSGWKITDVGGLQNALPTK